jgi:hypothetical protein
VGAGYAVRAVTGLALAVDLTARPGVAAAAVATAWAVGVAFVTCRWSLEAMPFAQLSGRRVLWRADRAQAREHTLGLVRWLPTSTDPRDLAPGLTPARWRALHGRTPACAPWNLATVTAALGAAVLGGLLGGMPTAVTVPVAVAGLLAGLGVALVPRRRAAVALPAAALLAVLHLALDTTRPVLAALPCLAVLLAHTCFTSQCAAELGRPLHRLDRVLQRSRGA